MKVASPAAAARTLLRSSPLRPTFAIVLGSGLECPLDPRSASAIIPYQKVPGYPGVGVAGHPGSVAIGKLAGEPVLLLRGRCHFYEGHSMSSVTFAVRSLAHYGIRHLLLTNAAGAINSKFSPCEFMVIKDHLNLMGVNPLRGEPFDGAAGFVDLTHLYDPMLRRLLKQAAKDSGLKLREGIYVAVSGPSYETPAEIKAFRRLGADAVGMSSVPEAIVAHQCGIKVAALSCLTNRGAGLSRRPVSHAEVLLAAARVKQTGRKLLNRFAELLSKASKRAE